MTIFFKLRMFLLKKIVKIIAILLKGYNMKTISAKKIFFRIFVIFTLFLFAFLSPLCILTAKADGEIKSYYLINQNTSLIPKDQKIQGNIRLNSTYYVEATGKPNIDINGTVYRSVVYNGITGLVPSYALSKKSINNVQSPFFLFQSKLTIKSNGYDVFMLENINNTTTECRKLQNDEKLDFIAYSERDNYILARLSDNTVGFVGVTFCTPTVIYTPHPNPINPDDDNSLPSLTPDNPSADEKETSKATITRIILIITLCVVVVIVIFLIFKPTNSKRASAKKDDFYDF